MNYNKTLRYLLDKAKENKKLAFTVFTDKGDSDFGYSKETQEFLCKYLLKTVWFAGR